MLILYHGMITCVHDFKKSHMHVNGLNPGLHLLRLLSVPYNIIFIQQFLFLEFQINQNKSSDGCNQSIIVIMILTRTYFLILWLHSIIIIIIIIMVLTRTHFVIPTTPYMTKYDRYVYSRSYSREVGNIYTTYYIYVVCTLDTI